MFTLPILIFLNEPYPMFIICFLCFSCCFLCVQQLLWNMGTDYTKYDRTVGYNRPIQLPWPNQVTILNYCMVLRTTLMWESCHYSVGGDRHWNIFVSPPRHCIQLSSSFTHFTTHLLFAVQSDHWTAACRSPTGRGFLMLSTVACGDGRTYTATTSCAPSRPVSMPST